MRFHDIGAFQRAGFQPQVCIIGSGPAGLSLALSLADRRIPSLVLEAGGLTWDEASQALYEGVVVGDPYFDLRMARLRQFGGTSGHWQGWCRPLDEDDFDVRPHMAHSGWPIRKSDLDPYTDATHRLLEISEQLPVNRALNADVEEFHMVFSPPTRFGDRYRDRIERSPHIGLIVEATLKELVPVAGRIGHAQVVDKAGQEHRISAHTYVLCAGGIENSRLLLWSNARHNGGVVPQAQALGRYWMEHPHFTVGDAILVGDAVKAFEARRFFGLSPAAKARLRTPAAGIRVSQRIEGSQLKELVRSGMCVAPDFFERAMHMAGRSLTCGLDIRMAWEQPPRPDNRIALDERRDRFGIPLPRLHWRKDEADRETAIRALEAFGRYLIEHGLGRARIRHWLVSGDTYPTDDEGAGFHHMGGTRMAAAPAEGVVDRNCRVFGVDNLYVGGSSVFATGGHANPTYTIVQLAVRLADHLARTGRS